jgi:hypothetical protein
LIKKGKTKQNISNTYHKLRRLFSDKIVLLHSLLIILPLFIFSIIIAPNNWDSLTYHLPKIIYWIQNRNINQYPTNDLSQVFTQPFGEYLLLNVKLTTVGDYLLNSVQFTMMVGTVILSTLFAKHFNINSKGQILFGIATLSIPIGLMESITTQNDYVAAFFLISGIYFIVVFTKTKNSIDLIFANISLSLGLITKLSIAFFAFPFLVFEIYYVLRFFKRNNIFKIAIASTFFFVLFNAPHYLRNKTLTQNFLGDVQITNFFRNETFSLNVTLSNLSRNIGYQLNLPFNEFNDLNVDVQKKIHSILGLSIHDVKTSMRSKYIVKFKINEDRGTNFIVITLFTVTLIIYVFNRKIRDKDISLIVLLIVTGFIVYSTIFKYTPYATRYFIGPFVIMSIFSSYVIYKIGSRIACNIFLIFLFFHNLPFVYNVETRDVDLFDYLKNKIKIAFEILPKKIQDKPLYEKYKSKADDGEKKLLTKGYNNLILNKEILTPKEEKSIYLFFKREKSYESTSILSFTRSKQYFYFPDLIALARYNDYKYIINFIKNLNLDAIGIINTQTMEYLFMSHLKNINYYQIVFPDYFLKNKNLSLQQPIQYVIKSDLMFKIDRTLIKNRIKRGDVELIILKKKYPLNFIRNKTVLNNVGK